MVEIFCHPLSSGKYAKSVSELWKNQRRKEEDNDDIGFYFCTQTFKSENQWFFVDCLESWKTSARIMKTFVREIDFKSFLCCQHVGVQPLNLQTPTSPLIVLRNPSGDFLMDFIAVKFLGNFLPAQIEITKEISLFNWLGNDFLMWRRFKLSHAV